MIVSLFPVNAIWVNSYAKRAHSEGLSLREAAIASGHLTAQEFDAWVVPANMVGRRGL